MKKHLQFLSCSILILSSFLYGAETTIERLEKAIKENNSSQVIALLDASPMLIHEKIILLQQSPLHIAVSQGNLEIVNILLVRNADINMRDLCDRTPLHLAAEKNNVAIIKALIEHGADVNAKDDLENTPLHCAVEEKNTEILQLLIDHGAHKNSKNFLDCTPEKECPSLQSLKKQPIIVPKDTSQTEEKKQIEQTTTITDKTESTESGNQTPLTIMIIAGSCFTIYNIYHFYKKETISLEKEIETQNNIHITIELQENKKKNTSKESSTTTDTNQPDITKKLNSATPASSEKTIQTSKNPKL